MYDTTYHKATSLDDAAAKMGAADDGKFLGGGQTLIPTLKARLAAPSDLIDVTAIAGMTGIGVEGDTLVIGAATTHAEVATSDAVRAHTPALAALASHIGDPAVRHKGTIGGSIANNDPAADYPAACLGLGATIVTNNRELSADDFFTGMFETALAEDEIIIGIKFPKASKAAYEKFPNPASRYAMVGAFVAASSGGTRVAITGAGSDGVFRHTAAEAALGDGLGGSLDGVATDAGDMLADIHGTADYRAHLVGVMIKRAVAKV